MDIQNCYNNITLCIALASHRFSCMW